MLEYLKINEVVWSACVVLSKLPRPSIQWYLCKEPTFFARLKVDRKRCGCASERPFNEGFLKILGSGMEMVATLSIVRRTREKRGGPIRLSRALRTPRGQ